MKNRHSLLEVGASLFFFGLSMILFPFIFEKSETHHLVYPENIYMGLLVMLTGSVLLLIKWYIVKKEKNNDKTHNDNFSSK